MATYLRNVETFVRARAKGFRLVIVGIAILMAFFFFLSYYPDLEPLWVFLLFPAGFIAFEGILRILYPASRIEVSSGKHLSIQKNPRQGDANEVEEQWIGEQCAILDKATRSIRVISDTFGADWFVGPLGRTLLEKAASGKTVELVCGPESDRNTLNFFRDEYKNFNPSQQYEIRANFRLYKTKEHPKYHGFVVDNRHVRLEKPHPFLPTGRRNLVLKHTLAGSVIMGSYFERCRSGGTLCEDLW